MDPSTSSELKDFTVSSLPGIEPEKEKELAEQARLVVRSLLDLIKPIFHYVANSVYFDLVEGHCRWPNSSPAEARVMRLDNVLPAAGTRELFLDLDNTLGCGALFYSAELCGKTTCGNYHLLKSEQWERLSLKKIVEALQGVLNTAHEKRAKYLESIEKRKRELDQILEILNK